jgi:hypothetical protein
MCLNAVPGNPRATIVADLCDAPRLPGGVLLATVKGVGGISQRKRIFTGPGGGSRPCSVSRVAGEAFGDATIVVETYGNVLVAARVPFGSARAT